MRLTIPAPRPTLGGIVPTVGGEAQAAEVELVKCAGFITSMICGAGFYGFLEDNCEDISMVAGAAIGGRLGGPTGAAIGAIAGIAARKVAC